jgi:hypothetical protein
MIAGEAGLMLPGYLSDHPSYFEDLAFQAILSRNAATQAKGAAT